MALAVESRTTSATDSASLTHIVTMPAGVVSGNLLLAFLAIDGISTIMTLPTGWTAIKSDLDNGNSSALFSAFYKQSDGSEGASEDWVINGVTTEKSTHATLRISGHINPGTQAPEVSTGAADAGADTAPDPDAVTPTGGSKAYLFVAAAGLDGISALITGDPTNYLNGQNHVGTSGGGTSIMTAERLLTAASDDPSAFTLDSAARWAAMTVVVHPAAAGVENASVLNGLIGGGLIAGGLLG